MRSDHQHPDIEVIVEADRHPASCIAMPGCIGRQACHHVNVEADVLPAPPRSLARRARRRYSLPMEISPPDLRAGDGRQLRLRGSRGRQGTNTAGLSLLDAETVWHLSRRRPEDAVKAHEWQMFNLHRRNKSAIRWRSEATGLSAAPRLNSLGLDA